MNQTVDSNSTGLAIAVETSLRTLPLTPIWYELEPNSFTDFGSETKTVARSPIKPDRQRKKGIVVDIDAAGGFDMDLTQSITSRLMQGFLFAEAHEKFTTAPFEGNPISLSFVAADDSFMGIAGLAGFKANDLVFASGCIQQANNGLHKVVSVVDTKVVVASSLVNEVGTATAKVEVVGYSCASGDINLVVDGSLVKLNSTTLDFTTLALNVGEFIFIGGDTASTRFTTNVPGYARISAIEAHTLSLDDTTFVPSNETGTGKTISLFFGTMIRNESDVDLIKRYSYQIERQLGSDVNGIQCEYLTGAVANELTINLAEASKIDAQLGFVAMDHEQRTSMEGIKSGTRVMALKEDAYNTSSNLYRAKISLASGLNAGALFAYGSEMKLSIKNNVKPLKALGVLGAFEASTGTFEVSATMEAYFSDISAVSAVRENDDVAVNVIAADKNKGFILDMPLVSLGNGKLKVEKDNPIMVNLEINAAQCGNDYTLLTNFFQYLPDVAMPQ